MALKEPVDFVSLTIIDSVIGTGMNLGTTGLNKGITSTHQRQTVPIKNNVAPIKNTGVKKSSGQNVLLIKKENSTVNPFKPSPPRWGWGLLESYCTRKV